MRAAKDDYDELEPRDRGATWFRLYFVLWSGAGMLAFLGWLLTR